LGLALDYCVKYSALDARHLGLNTNVIVDGCRGIELEPGEINRALDEMKRAGAVLLKSSDLQPALSRRDRISPLHGVIAVAPK
jgi:nicotinamidase/pyrazinamidase